MSKSKNTSVQGYSKADIVTIAVFQLGGIMHYIHTEDIAIKAAELSPRSFSWEKYPERVNLEVVRLALKYELSSKSSRIAGGIRNGWMLKPRGVDWCVNSKNFVVSETNKALINKEIVQAQASSAYYKIMNGKITDISDVDIKSLMRINEYFSTRDIKERVLALTNIAVIDPNLSQVLDCLITHGYKELEVSYE